MEPEVARPESPPDRSVSGERTAAADAGPEPAAAPEARPEPVNPIRGARGALIAIAVSGLLILGLWLIARDAPSAGTDPRLAPTATVAAGALEAGALEGRSGPFVDKRFVTAVPQPGPRPADVTAGEAGEP